MQYPETPVAAVTHPNPYPYYADLVAHKPIYFDDTLGCWVASSADAVSSVLTSDLCRARPLKEPVPTAIVGSSAADIFMHLVRMNDGERHQPFKQAVIAALGSIDKTQAAEQSSKWAKILLNETNQVSDMMFRLPVYVVANLLGVPEEKLDQTTQWISEFIACLAPAARQEPLEHGAIAARHLLDLFQILWTQPHGLLSVLAHEAQVGGRAEQNVIIANAIGFMSQAYEATAALIGNTLLALATGDDLRQQIMSELQLLSEFILEVLRYDAPVQNTRRFVAADGIVAGQTMRKNDAILIVLAAANRDPAVNPHPQQFDIFRQNRQLFTFGVGTHACPGDNLATIIATAVLQQMLLAGFEFEQLSTTPTYRPSANVRIPTWS